MGDDKHSMKRLIRTSVLLFAWLVPSSQAIQVSEVMYHPSHVEGQTEWIELYNEAPSRRSIGGWSFSQGIEYLFPDPTTMEPGEYLILAADPNRVMAAHGLRSVFGPFTGRLANSGERIVLSDKFGASVVEVRYRDRDGWPVAPDGTGHSLTKVNLRGDPMDPKNWRPSQRSGGHPVRATLKKQGLGRRR